MAAQIRKSGAAREGGIAVDGRRPTMRQRVKFVWRRPAVSRLLVNQEGDDTLSPIDRAAAAIGSS